jgi:hypothetical protein
LQRVIEMIETEIPGAPLIASVQERTVLAERRFVHGVFIGSRTRRT